MNSPSPIVAALIGLDAVSLDHRIRLTPAQAHEFFKMTDSRHGLIEAIDQNIPLMNFPQSDNPNNGKTHHTYGVGKEGGGRVLYVEVVHAYIPMSGLDLNATLAKIDANVGELAKKWWDANEYDMKRGGGSTNFRLWWR